MKKIVILTTIVLLTGCSSLSTTSETEVSTESRVGSTTLTGSIIGEGSAAVLTTDDGEIHSVESYEVDFTKYSGETVTVTGQYSGTTLFVDEIISVN